MNLIIENNSESLKSLLESLIDDKSWREELSRKSMSIIERDYDLENFLVALADFYREVALKK